MVLVEAYDASPAGRSSDAPRLANLSARAAVTASGQLIAGFFISGVRPKALLVRAAGPALAKFQLPGALADPVLEVRRAGVVAPLAMNDDWEETAPLTAAFARVGAFAFDRGSRDAVLMLDLEPGAYTAEVRGKGAGGAALLEIYEIP